MDAGLIAMRMRLSGGKEVAAEAETATAAVEETTAATDAANKKVAKSGNAIRSSLSRQITGLRSIGRSLTKYIAVPLAAVAIGSGVMAAHFDRSMNLVATDAGGSVKEVGKLKGEVLDLARHSQFGPQKLADSLFHVESSGYRGAKAMRVLNEAQKLATAGNSDLESTTYALVSAVKALNGGDSLKGVTKTAAQLNEIVSHGDIRLEELTSAMSTGLLPTAKALGLSVADVGSALDVMTKRGIPAQRSAYALNFTLQKLVPSTEKAEKAFKALGIGEEQLLRTAQKKGLPAALGLLRDKLQGLTRGKQIQLIDEMFGGGRMSKGLLVAIQHVGEMKELWGQVDGNVALYKKHVREAEAQPLVRAQRAWSTVQASLIEIGQVLLPAAIPAMEALAGGATAIAHTFASLSPSTQHWIVGIAAVAAVLGPVLLLTAKLLEMWKTIRELQVVSAVMGGFGEARAAGSLALGGELGGFGMMSRSGRFATGAAGVVGAQVAGNAIGGKGGELVSNIGTGAAGGFAFGGPMGAAVGATAGAVATALPEWEALLGLTKKLGPMQGRVVASSKELSTAIQHQAKATHGLNGANQRLQQAEHIHTRTTKALKDARQRLNAVVQRYGPDSRAAIRAEAKLTEKIDDHRRALHRLQKAEQLHGTALAAYKTETAQTILAERHRINTLKTLRDRQSELFLEARAQNPASQKTIELAHNLLGTEGKLSEAVQKHAGTLQEAAAKAGPKYAHFLQHGTQESLRFGGALKATAVHAEGLMRNLERLSETQFSLPKTEEINPFNNGEVFPHHRRNHPRHKNTAAEGSPEGSTALALKLGRKSGGRPQRIEVPVYLNKRKIAEAVVEAQEDEDARL